MNRRRKTLAALGAGLLARALPAFAQQAPKPSEKVWRIGILVQAAKVSASSDSLKEFLRGMREHGYVEGRNLQVDWRYADNQLERLPALAAELLALRPDVLVANANAAPLALQKATSTVPIVMLSMGDPVGSGLVKSLAHPGGNITGLSVMGELGPKLMDDGSRYALANLLFVAVLQRRARDVVEDLAFVEVARICWLHCHVRAVHVSVIGYNLFCCRVPSHWLFPLHRSHRCWRSRHRRAPMRQRRPS